MTEYWILDDRLPYKLNRSTHTRWSTYFVNNKRWSTTLVVTRLLVMKGEEEEEVRLKDGKYNHVQWHSDNKKDMSTVQAQCCTEASKVLSWCELVPVLDSTMSTVRRQWYRHNRSTSTNQSVAHNDGNDDSTQHSCVDRTKQSKTHEQERQLSALVSGKEEEANKGKGAKHRMKHSMRCWAWHQVVTSTTVQQAQGSIVINRSVHQGTVILPVLDSNMSTVRRQQYMHKVVLYHSLEGTVVFPVLGSTISTVRRPRYRRDVVYYRSLQGTVVLPVLGSTLSTVRRRLYRRDVVYYRSLQGAVVRTRPSTWLHPEHRT